MTTYPRHRTTVLALAVALAVAIPATAQIANQPRQGSLKAGRQVPVPFPGSPTPDHLVANILAILQATDMTVGIEGLRERLLEPGLQAGVVRRVWLTHSRTGSSAKSAPPDYYVADLQDRTGRPIAIVGITADDEPIGIEDFRDGPGEPHGDPMTFTGRLRARPLLLADASARVARAFKLSVRSARYEFFSSIAERGISVLRPLVALDTDQGTVYVNSRGQAFADPDAPLAKNHANGQSPAVTAHGQKDLVFLSALAQ